MRAKCYNLSSFIFFAALSIFSLSASIFITCLVWCLHGFVCYQGLKQMTWHTFSQLNRASRMSESLKKVQISLMRSLCLQVPTIFCYLETKKKLMQKKLIKLQAMIPHTLLALPLIIQLTCVLKRVDGTCKLHKSLSYPKKSHLQCRIQ